MDHIGLLTVDFAAAKAFYRDCLATLGWEFRDYGEHGAAFRKPGSAVFYITPADRDATGLHLAFRAGSRGEVDAFHRVAIASGAADNGAPGLRPDYADGYYAAFVLDRAGNNLEAVYYEDSDVR